MRLAIISDIHEDIVRLRKAMSIIEKKNVDEIVCLGDIVGYNLPYYNYYDSRDASECVQIVQQNCKFVLAGNHDLFEAKKIPQNKAGFEFPDDWYELDYERRNEISNGKVWLHERNSLASLLTKKEKEYLYELPESVITDFGKEKILFSHFLCPDFTGSRADFVMRGNVFDSHLDFMKKNDCSLSFSGHAHFEGVCSYNNKGKKKLNSFGQMKVEKEMRGFLGPCIAKGRQSNGLLIFDTETKNLEIISLGFIQQIKQSVTNILKQK